jgi:hypothetical protein
LGVTCTFIYDFSALCPKQRQNSISLQDRTLGN